MYQGDTRTRTIDVYVDNVMITSWTSSGTTTVFENIDLEVTGQAVELRGVLTNSEWLSITEVEILVDDGGTSNAVLASSLSPQSTSALLYDTNLAVDGGCDPNGCTASNTQDGELGDMSRWSCAPLLGGTCSISYTFGIALDLSELRLALYRGDTRVRTVDVYVDGVHVITWTSSGTTDGFESIYLSGMSGTTIEIVGVLANSEWLSIIETEILAWPATAATLAPAPVQPVTPPSPTPGAILQPVGLTPLAIGSGSDLERFGTKDGDLGTSWSCTGGPNDPESIFYDCDLFFGLVYWRNIKQVKIALADGAGRAVDMRIWGRFDSDDAEEFVTSSGTTDGLETYDFDYKATSVRIAPIFSAEGQTITISEVEIVEEVVEGEVPIYDFDTPSDLGDTSTINAFEWIVDSDDAIGLSLDFDLAGFFTVTEVQLVFPVGDTYKFDLTMRVYSSLDGTEPYVTVPGLESNNIAGWQSFDLTGYTTQPVTSIGVVVQGTGSGAPGFALLDARVLGTQADNPTDTVYVGSTMIEYWDGDRYPDFVAEATGDQYAINSAICAVKKADYDGVDCVGGDDTATGTVDLSFGPWYVDGSIVMKSGVVLEGRFSDDDAPNTTDIQLEESAAGDTDMEAIIVMDGISDARVEEVDLRGQYDPGSNANSPVGSGYGPACVSVTDSQNVTLYYTDVRSCDGDGIVVHNSQVVNIDAGRYDDEFNAWDISSSRGTGLIIDSTDHIWIRRHEIFDNGVAGIYIVGSNNFTFEATYPTLGSVGEGSVGTRDGQQPIEVIIETSTDIKFDHMRVKSLNDPVMTISGSTAVSFTNCGFADVDTGTCVIQTDDPSTVTIDADEDELSLVGTCYEKV